MDRENGVCVIPKLRERIGMSGIQAKMRRLVQNFYALLAGANYTSKGEKEFKTVASTFLEDLRGKQFHSKSFTDEHGFILARRRKER